MAEILYNDDGTLRTRSNWLVAPSDRCDLLQWFGVSSAGTGMDQTQISDTWERGDSYEMYIGRWSRRVAPLFLAWLGIPPDRKWLDVGCGTGALCAAIVDHCSPSSVAGVEPSEGFFKTATAQLAGRATIYRGTAAAI